MNYLGDYTEDDTVYLMFNTYTSDDPSASSTITNLANTDVHIHKDDGLTQRNNAAGITVSVDFDGITGSHMIKIDTSDDTVGGFWVAGSDYFVRIEGTTVDGATINAVVGHFSIENRFMQGTDSAALASVCTETRLAELDSANIPSDLDNTYVAASSTFTIVNSGVHGNSALKALIDALNNVSVAQIESEMSDALKLDTIPDSYATDGDQPTIVQAILATHQMMQEKSISGTTLTVKKPDGSTTAMTFTLDSATSPTSVTRAT